MSSRSPDRREQGRDKTRSNVTGIGGGTGLLGIADAIGVHTPAGQAVMFVAPLASYLISAVFYYLELQASRRLQLRQVERARDTLILQLNNPHTSQAHKIKTRKNLEALEESWAKDELRRATVTFDLPDVQPEGQA